MILELSHPIVWLVRHVCPIKLNFPFCKGIPLFGALLTVYRGLSDVFIVTVIARNRINGVGSLFFHDRILGFGENMPQSLKRFLSNFKVFLYSHLPLGHWKHISSPQPSIGWDTSTIITTNWCYHQRLCLEARLMLLLHQDDDSLLPDAYLHLVRKKATN